MTIKRPLLGLAGSFVLGEVLALLDVAAKPENIQTAVLSAALLCAVTALCGWIPGRIAGKSKGRGGIRERKRALGTGSGQSRGTGIRVLLLFLAVFFLAGYGRAEAVERRLDMEAAWAAGISGVKVTAAGRIERLEEKDGKLEMWLGETEAQVGQMRGKFGKILAYVDWEAGKDVPGIGAAVSIRGKLEAVAYATNPGEFDFSRYYRSKGVACRMYGEALTVQDGTAAPYYEGLRRFRGWCGRVLENVCAPEDLGVFQAVVLGDQSAMDPQMRDMYRSHGISHLLAVSGQHLAIVGGGIYMILRKSGMNRGKAGLAGGGLVVSYGLLTGGSGSALRAVVMILCLWLAEYLGRSYDCLSAMGLAGIWLLWRQPYLLLQSGFQLSFGAVWAIGGLGSLLCHVLNGKKGWQRTLIASLSVQLVLAPVTVWHYFRYPLYGLALNLMVVPLAAVLVYSGILGITLGAVWQPAGVFAVGAGHYVLAFYEWLCGLFAKLPGYSLLVGRPGWGQMAAYGIGVAAGVWWTGRTWGRGDESGRICRRGITGRIKRPGSSAVPGFRWRGLACVFGLYALCFTLLLPRPSGGLRITCLDVGQGDGLVLECAGGVVTVDGGSSSRSGVGERCMEPFLESRAVGRIDYAVVSHGDSDHMNGLLELLEGGKVQIGCLVLPRMGRGQEAYQRLRLAARNCGTRVVYMEAGDIITLGELKLCCLYAGDPEKETDRDKNRHSLVIRATYGNFGLLLTGDMDAACEADMLRVCPELELEGIQVLKTAHHGSDTSSSVRFLEALGARLALVSYGNGNSYGHPSGAVLERMEERGIQVWETGKSGAILLETDGKRLRCRGWRGSE